MTTSTLANCLLVPAVIGLSAAGIVNMSMPGDGDVTRLSLAQVHGIPGYEHGNSRTMRAAIEDSVTTGKVRSALAGAGVAGPARVAVETRNGVVTLSGHVADVAQAQRAETVARSIEGVASVVNRLSVAP